MKIYLQDESSTIWNILGGNFFMKLWMYEEGLISIDHIILSALSDETSITSEYFLPEIIENDIECFHKEIKLKHKIFADEKKYSNIAIQKFKEQRQKYFKWILDCGDYCDPSYREIETDRLRLAIKTDDIDSFQKIISNSNLSINMTIRESVVETFLSKYLDISLIKYAINYNSTKIIKFLILNDVVMDCGIVSYSIFNGDYDLIHLIESRANQQFEKCSLTNAVSFWHHKISHYIISNYSYYSILNAENKENFTEEEKDIILGTFEEAIRCCNFRFFKNKLLKFLKHNPQFIQQNIHELINISFKEMSCFFLKEFLKFPQIDINYINSQSKESILIYAIYEKNSNAIEYLLNNYPQLDVNSLGAKYSPLYFASGSFCDMKSLKLICSHPEIDIKFIHKIFNVSIFEIAFLRGNIIATRFFFSYFNIVWLKRCKNSYILHLLRHRHLLILKFYLKLTLENKSTKCREKRIIDARRMLLLNQGNSDNFYDDFSQIIKELGY